MWIGIILAICASLCGTTGKQLFRFAELKRLEGIELESEDLEISQLRERQSKIARVLALVIMSVCSPLLDLASYGFAAQSVIAPFAGTDITANLLLAPYTLGEAWTKTRVGGAALIAVGTVMVAVFGPEEDIEYSSAYLHELLVSWRVGIYLLALVAFLGSLIAFQRGRPEGELLRGITLGIVAGVLSGNMWCVKATVEFIKTVANDGAGTLADWLPWVCVVGAVFFALSNLKFIEQGMREQEALMMGTLYEGCNILAGCLSGTVVLRELDERDNEEIQMYLVSLMIISSGLCTLWYGEIWGSRSAKGESSTAFSSSSSSSSSENTMAIEMSRP
eukprot:TRINITY_DN45393_c0_g1_i1.p1 TRINITY_DN45393_c0_g1~~TRINITY_DN45393_c0_g1_i1.p1  ORF type:complete len:346 (-),score=52.41 TRINITY_DN45393_c0_g1_i1:68-1069(-)